MDYAGIARSNYFRVKDAAAFRAFVKELPGVRLAEKDDRFALLADEGWPSSRSNDDDLDIIQELAPHIADGNVAVLMAVGYEGMRYVDGVAVAVNNKGETRRVSLEEIYKLAEDLAAPGTEVTLARF